MSLFNDEVDSYRRLLSCVVWLAVHDACQKPVSFGPRALHFRPCEEAAQAIRFLFEDGQGSYFRKYLECMGMDPDSFRSKLVSTMYKQDDLRRLPFNGLPQNAQRNFRFNHHHWLTHFKGEVHATQSDYSADFGSSACDPVEEFLESSDGDPRATKKDRGVSLRTRAR